MIGVNSYNDFSNDEQKVDAVILNLEQIGETAKKLSLVFKMSYSNVNWPSIVGLRNMISHEYEGIKVKDIYEIATEHIGTLIKELSQ